MGLAVLSSGSILTYSVCQKLGLCHVKSIMKSVPY